MRRVSAISAIAFLCAAPACALAAPATVNLRVEGEGSTTFEAPVTTDGKTVGGHPCDGTNGGINPSPGPTMTSALDDGAATGAFTWSGTWFAGFDDFGIDRIGPDVTDFVNNKYWGYALNHQTSPFGGCQMRVHDGDEVLFGYDYFGKSHLLKLTGPNTAQTGVAIEVEVTDGGDGSPISGASVGGQSTDGAGTANVQFTGPGVHRLKAERPDSLRSNVLEVCVSDPGASNCEGFVPQVGPGSAASAVHDSSAPSALIAGLRNGSRLRRGPRVLKGTAADQGSGIAQIKLSLRRHGGGRCSWWSATAERFSGAGCKRKVFFAIGDDANWSYQLPKALGSGHYVLDVKVRDRAGNIGSSFVRGQDRVVFDVVGGARRTARTSAAAARVEVMIVGKGERVLADARTVTARAVAVRASGRRCRVAASSPLAALVAAAGRLRLGIKDYGSCSRRNSRDSAQLFVRSIGADRNGGQDGWVYKLRGKVPATGAADRSTRIRTGDRLVWFYCVHATDGSCQRTLELGRLGPINFAGSQASIAVRAIDDQGRQSVQAGVRVEIGSEFALSGADGAANVALPVAGSYRMRATKAGTVPAFPEAVEVISLL